MKPNIKTELDLELLTQQVSELALEMGKFLHDERQKFDPSRIEIKGIHDYVSYVDKESEQQIVNQLSKLLPEAGFIAEEEHHTTEDVPYYWLIDPLDGTTNFIHNTAPYCVSIGLCNQKEMLIGVVLEVCRCELYSAYKRGGAILTTPAGSETIHVSEVDDADKAFLGLGFPYQWQKYKPMAHHLIENLYGKVMGLRLMGACSAEICYIAAGRFEGRIESLLGPWDIAAASLILREAGGKITDFKGEDLFYNSEEVLASNGKMHPYLLKTIQNMRE